MGHHRVCQLQAAQGAGVRASEATASGQREIRKVLVGLGRISEADTYRHTHPLFTEIGKKWILGRYVSATYPRVSISDTYPIRDTRPWPRIRVT